MQQSVCTTRAHTQPLLFLLHLVSNGSTHPGDAAQDLPLPFSLALTASLCSLCCHLWLLLLLLILHYDGEREKERQSDSLTGGHYKVTELRSTCDSILVTKAIFQLHRPE